MKTSILELIKQWCKKNWKYLLLVALVIVLISWISIRETVIKRQTREIAELEFANTALEHQRSTLEIRLKILQSNYDSIEHSNDSMKLVLNQKEKELKEMRKRHEAIIDSLMKIPDDTIFTRLQYIYPNFNNTPLKYPFSGSQIRQVYNTALRLPMLEQEYNLQGKSLVTCKNLNTGYEKGIVNLENQIGNLQNNIKLADDQIGNYKKEVDILNNRIKKKGFWTRFWQVTALTSVVITALK